MIQVEKKRYYKVISLLVKAVILIFSLYYIYQRISEASETLNFKELIKQSNIIYLIDVIILMFFNWGLEALKWQLLIKPLEPISFKKSIQSIFAGIAVSIFTPSRVGEFVGRIFFLEKASKIEASLKSFVGSAIQLLVTIIAGIIAYFVLDILYTNFFQIQQAIPFKTVLIYSALTVLLLSFSVFYYLRKKSNNNIGYRKYINVFTDQSLAQLFIIFCLSLLRYAVFTMQYYLVLKFFGINAGITILLSLIALTFFVTSVIPTFAATEIAVRGATAVYFFSTISLDSSAIVASSVLLWIINLAIPALIGSFFILNLKIIKD